MINTALLHFQEDLARTRSLLAHARPQPAGVLKDDILRACWMLCVGACDAFFCDVYGDLVARTLRAKDLEPAINISDRLANLKVPAIAVIRRAAGGWRWRMAARELIQKENVLSLHKIRDLLNQFCRPTHKLIGKVTIENWILHPKARTRCFAIKSSAYRALGTPQAKATARKRSVERLEERFEMIFQRRHDCIHNCDRPKVALQSISDVQVAKVVEDIEFLVCQVAEALRPEFPIYLQNLGFSGVTRNRVLSG